MIRSIFIGKTKELLINKLITDYENKIKKIIGYIRIETKDIKINNIKFRLKQESKLINSKIKKNSIIICLDHKGILMSSVDLSNKIKLFLEYNKNISFIIGGPYGLDNDILKKSDLILSISRMTFTHEMCRILLIEQIYRSLCIIKNYKYHH